MQITDGELREWLNFLLLMSLNRRIHELMHDKYIVREILVFILLLSLFLEKC